MQNVKVQKTTEKNLILKSYLYVSLKVFLGFAI